jgi:hypothetical protein
VPFCAEGRLIPVRVFKMERVYRLAHNLLVGAMGDRSTECYMSKQNVPVAIVIFRMKSRIQFASGFIYGTGRIQGEAGQSLMAL